MILHRAPDAPPPQLTALILSQLSVVRRIALRVIRRLPPHVELDDLIAAGNMGLLEAASRFDPSRGRFPAYCYRRIYGAMMDFLRQGLMHTRRDCRTSREAGESLPIRVVQLDDDLDATSLADSRLNPEQQCLRADRRNTLTRALRALTRRERQILISAYADDRTLADIGTDHHIGESRVSQLRTAALATLRTALEVHR